MNDAVRCLTRTALLLRSDFFPSLDEETIVAGLLGQRVVIGADHAACASPAGQTAIAVTALLVSQLGAEVALELPAAPLLGRQPPFPFQPSLSESLIAGSADLIRPFTTVRNHADVAILIGSDPSLSARTTHQRRLWLSASDWGCELTPHPGGGPGGALPFGAILGAIAAAAECLRAAVAAIAARHDVTPSREHYLGPPRPVRLALPALALSAGMRLGEVDLVSAGAITNGILAALLRVESLNGALRVIDGDLVSLDNLNRCGLFTRPLVGVSKTEALAKYATAELPITPATTLLTEATIRQLSPLAPRVLVGVDSIPARWFVQSIRPAWLAVGGTSHFDVIDSEHHPAGPCAGCLHPEDDPTPGPVPTISFVSALAGLLVAYRLTAAAAGRGGAPPNWAWSLALHEQRGLTPIGLAPDLRCPVACDASRALRAARSTDLAA